MITLEQAIKAVKDECESNYDVDDRKDITVIKHEASDKPNQWGDVYVIEVEYNPVTGWSAIYGVDAKGHATCYAD